MNNASECIRACADLKQIHTGKTLLEKNAQGLRDVSQILNLGGNEVRLKILYLLEAEKELCVCDLTDILEMNVSAISQHLRKMKDGGIVNSRKDGQTIFYSLEPKVNAILKSIFLTIEYSSNKLKRAV
ncbi:MAG: helix-turn-helix transcriptional regulator [Bacteroidia bacterium]|nr:helix-turn-helix transcriptional regulator [Bacteroidia bacterium]